MPIAVAVACSRADAPLAQTLDALSRQTSDLLVALAGEASALETTASRHGARVVHAEGPGIANARNAALAACGEPVVALLDDDVQPEPGWLAAHTAAWQAAGPAVAIIGGPIAPTIVGHRPGWLTDSLLGVFGLVDHGGAARAIDGSTTRLLAGNLSIRVDVAAGLGGFWPMRGHSDLRGWYDSEAHLQQEAARSGWELSWTPDAAARRIVEADRLSWRGLVGRRYRHGSMIGAVGNIRTATEAGRQAAASAAGVPAALLLGRPTAALDRLARAAENLAVIAGGRTAAVALAPTGPTEFRPSVPVSSHRARRGRARRGSAIVLLYHRIADLAHDPLGLGVSREHFAEHLQVLGTREVVPLHELAAAVRRGRIDRDLAAITFDDGYSDNLTDAAPALQRAGLPATVFVVTNHVVTGKAFAWDIVAAALLGPGPRPERLELKIRDRPFVWRTDTPAGRDVAHRQIQSWLRTLDAARTDDLLHRLRSWAGTADPADGRPLTLEELGVLARMPGISIGAHSQRHLSLARQDEATRQLELRGSRDDLHDWTGTAPRGFAYPYGIPGEDVDEPTRSSARTVGYDYAAVNAPGPVQPSSDPMALPRLAVSNVGGAAFEQAMAESLRA